MVVLTVFDGLVLTTIISLLTISVLCSILAIALALRVKIDNEALKLSTHNVQYVPLDPNWGSSDKEINELNDKHQNDSEKDPDELEPYELNLDKMI